MYVCVLKVRLRCFLSQSKIVQIVLCKLVVKAFTTESHFVQLLLRKPPLFWLLFLFGGWIRFLLDIALHFHCWRFLTVVQHEQFSCNLMEESLELCRPYFERFLG